MITFIPKKGEGNAEAGIRAGCKALLMIFMGLPLLLFNKFKQAFWR